MGRQHMIADSLKQSRRLEMNHLYKGVILWWEVLPQAHYLIQRDRVWCQLALCSSTVRVRVSHCKEPRQLCSVWRVLSQLAFSLPEPYVITAAEVKVGAVCDVTIITPRGGEDAPERHSINSRSFFHPGQLLNHRVLSDCPGVLILEVRCSSLTHSTQSSFSGFPGSQQKGEEKSH